MIHRLLLAIALLISSVSWAQKTDFEYFNDKWLTSIKEEATYYRRFTADDSGFMVTDFTMAGKKLVEGHITSRKTGYANDRNGLFTYYSRKGSKVKEGNYVDGEPEGIWHYYSSDDDSVGYEVTYTKGMVTYEKSFDSAKRVKEESSVYMGNRVKSTSYSYYPNGQLKKRTQNTHRPKIGADHLVSYSNDIVKTQCFTEDGKEMPCDTAAPQKQADTFTFKETMPMPAVDMITYLSENIEYPSYSRKKNKQGRVIVSFVVMEDGAVEYLKLMNGVFPEIDEEAMRVIATMPKWKPGMQNGKAVKVMYTQPITFKLQ